MKIPKVLTICFVLCCLFTSNVFGIEDIEVIDECDSGLFDILGPNGGTYFQGDTICYSVEELIPDDPRFCTYENFEVYFFAPDNPPNADPICDATNGVLIISEPVFGPGSNALADCVTDPPALAYTVSLADVVNGNELKAQICTEFTLDGNPDSDSKTITNYVELQPCIDITKEACEFSKVGDEVIYTITIENCGDVALQLLSLEDSLLPLDPGLCPFLAPDEACTFDVPYTVQPEDLDPLINQVTVTALPVFDDGVIIVTEEVSDTAEAEVDLLHPDFTLDVECLLDPGVPNGDGSILVADTSPVNGAGGYALFQVCISNTGDVELDVEVQCLGLSLRLAPDEVHCAEIPIPLEGVGPCGTGGVAQFACDAIGRIPPEYCELPNELVRGDGDICVIPPCEPSFTVEKECLTSPLGSGVCDLQPGDPAQYAITITNTSLCEDPGQPLNLFFLVDDPDAGIVGLLVGPIPAGASWTETVEIPVPPCNGISGELPIPNVVIVEGFCENGDHIGNAAADAVCCYECCEPDFEVEKTCLTSPAGNGQCDLRPGDEAVYQIVITNTGTCDLEFIVEDPDAGIIQPVGPVPPDGVEELTVTIPVPPCPPGASGEFPMPNEVCVTGFKLDGSWEATKCDDATCCYNCNEPEGCTPGFWKNHPACWCDSYVPDMLISDVFTALQAAPYDTLDDDDRKSDFDTDTMLDALKYRGGRGLAGTTRNMLRHATAALLNGCSADVSYPLSDQLVIDLVNYALDSQDIGIIQDTHTLLAQWNEDTPCPIDAHCRRLDDEVNGN